MNILVHEVDGVPHLLLGPKFAFVLLDVAQKAVYGSDVIHRTPVTEFHGDALDQAEVEMVNDRVHDKAQNRLQEFGDVGLSLLAVVAQGGSDSIALSSSERVSSVLGVLNAVHCYLNRVGFLDGVVGEAQSDTVVDGQVSVLSSAATVEELLVKHLVALAVMEVTEVWVDAF